MFQKKLYFFFCFLAGIFFSNVSFAQLVINNTNPFNSGTYLVQNVLMGSGVTALNITFTGDSTAPSNQIGFFNGINSNLGLDSGIVLATEDVRKLTPGVFGGAISGQNNENDLLTIANSVPPLIGQNFTVTSINDKSILEFDFIPIGDSVEFKYVFGSDEYLTWINSQYNDVFAFFISGPGISGPYVSPPGFPNGAMNIAGVPNTSPLLPITVSSVNPNTNSQYYIDNPANTTVGLNGFTTVLTAKAIVQCGKTYHIKLAIADGSDGSLISAVFLQAKSFTSPGIEISLNTVLGDNNMNEGCADAYINFVRVDTDSVQIVYYEITGTATNGVDYVQIPDSVVFPVGQDSAQITVSLLNDGVPEGVENIVLTVYNVIPCTGDTVVETATLTINEGYDLTMSSVGDTVTCALDPATISVTASDGSPPYSYSWDNGMTGSPITVSTSVTDSFIVTASDLIGCKGADTVVVTVLFPLPAAAAGSDSSLCFGNSTQIGGSPTGPVGASFAWLPSGTLNSSTAANPTATPIITTSYIVTVTDTNTCKNKDTVVVTVFNLPVASAGNDTAICAGNSVQTGGSPTGPAGSGFSWSPPGSLNNSTLSNPTATPVANTNYIVTVTDTNNCVNKDTVNISLFALPVAVASNDTAICIGDSIQFIASGGVSYSWSPPTGLSSAINDTVGANPIITTTYIVTVTDNNNCVDTESVMVTVNAPGIADAGNDTSICIGDIIQVGSSPTGAPGSVFSWSPNQTINDTTIANPDVSPISSITYFVTVTDVNSCKSSDSITITVNNLPLADAGSDTTICTGNSLQIGGSPTGPLNSTFSWSPPGTLNNSSLSNPTATPVANTDYIVTVTDTNSCINSDTVNVSLFTLPVAIAGNDTAICIGDTIQLIGSGGVLYSWSPAAGLSTTTNDTVNASPVITTVYTVTVTDINGCSDTESVIISVNNLPAVNAGNDTAICTGDTIQIGGSPTSATGINFSWLPATNLSNASVANPDAFPVSAITYTVVVSDANTCSNSDSIVVSVNILPVADAGSDTTICTGNSLQIGGFPTGPTGSTFSWSPPGTLNTPSLSNPTATPIANTDYIVTVTDTNSCINSDTVNVSLFVLPVAIASNDTSICTGDTIQLIASGGVSYSWSPPMGLNAANIFDPLAFPSLNTIYTVTVTDANSCSDTETVAITLFNLPVINAGNDTAICIGDTIQIGGSPTSATGINFNWSPVTNLSNAADANPDAFPVSTITYTVIVTDANTCSNTDSIVVIVNNLPVVDAGDDTTICDGVSVVIGGNPTGPLNSIFSWSPATALSSTNVSNPTATPSSNITYTVIVTDTNSCVNTDDISFVVNANPVADAGPGGTVCVGDSIQLNASGGGVYSWTPVDSLTNPNISDPIAFPADTATYFLIVTDGNNCKDTDSVIVNVNQLPPADAGPDLWVCPNDSIMITATGGVIYSWLPLAGLSDATISNPMASPADTTEYFVTVTDANGCVNIDSMILDVGLSVPTDAGADKAICIFDTTQIGGNPTAPMGSTFSWNTSNGLSDTAIANPLTFPLDTIMYYVTTTNFTCTGFDSVLVIVNPLPIVDAGIDVPICIFDSTQLTATGGISYVWTPADSLSDDSIANPFAFPTDTTEYFVTVIDVNGCENIDSVTVIVNPLPTVVISNDVEICTGDSTQLSASGGVNFAWLPADSLTDDSISNPVAFPSDTTNYVVTVTNGNGCVNSDSVIVTVNPLPVIAISSDVSICIGDTTQLNASGGDTYSWFPVDSLSDPNVSAPFAFPSDTTTYVVTVVDSNSCVNKDSVTVTINPLPNVDAGPGVAICIFDSAQLNASGGTSYAWIPADSLSDDSINNPIAFPADTTLYFVTATDINGCINLDSIEVIVNSLPTIIISNDIEICIGDSTQLSASGGVNYAWLPSDSLTDDSISNPVAFPSDTTAYIVTVTDGNTCVNKDSVTVTVNPLPTISITGNLIICYGDTTQLTASGGDTYSWAPADSLNNPDISNPLAFPSDTTTYTVTVVDSNACVNSDSATIIVNPLPNVDAGLDDTICISDTTQLNATGASTYIWNPTDSLSNPNISNPLSFPSDTIVYYVSGTDNNSCTNTDSVKIIVNTLPVVIISPDTEICIGDSVQLFAAGGNSYAWSPTDSLTNPFIFNPIAFPSDTTIYVVTVTDINNCVNKDSVTVEVNPLPSNILGSDLEICIGDSTQLNASGGNNYSWTPTGSLDNPNIQNPIAFPSDTTMYIVTVVDSNGCSNSDSITVEVNLLPAVDAGLNDTICMGDTAQLNATGALNYSWSPTNSLTDANISAPLAFPSDTLTYYVSGTDTNNCINNDSVTIIVNPLPVIVIIGDTEICIGDSIQLNAGGGVSCGWLPVDSLTAPNIFNPIAFPADTTTYVVTVTDANNCVNKDSVTIEVNLLPSNILGSDVEICIGDSTQLNASGGDIYSWTPTDSLDSPNISNPMAFPSDTTLYIVTVVDSNGCINSDSITIEVNLLPVVDAGLDDTICLGDTAVLNATGAVNYVWNPAGSLSNPAIENPSAFPTDTTLYFVSGTDSNSCSNTDSVLIVVNPLPITSINSGADTVTACNGDSVQLNATGGITYLWNPSTGLNNINISNPVATISGTQEYFVSVSDSNSCSNIDSITVGIFNSPAIDAGADDTICSGDTVQLNASGGNTFNWSPANSLSDPTINNPLAFPSGTTEYFVSALDSNACIGTDTVLVIVNTLPLVDAGNDTSICISDTMQLNATGAEDFQWSPNSNISNPNIANPFAFPSVSAEYFLIGTDSNNCINTDSITITVNPLPVADAGNDTASCSGAGVQLNASGGSNYFWSPSTGLNNSNIANPIATLLNDSIKYFVTVTDANGCKGFDSLIIKTFSISVIPDTSICIGDSAKLIVTAVSGYLPYTYFWSPAIGLNNALIANPNAAPNASITYSVTVTENNGCSDSADININVNENPSADFTFKLEPSCIGAVAEFENKSKDADSYLWIFGDNKTSAKENPGHQFLYNQMMDVTLIAINGSGCDDSSSVSQSIKSFDDYFDIIIPNVFTPDGDGKNDWFEIRFDNKLQECTDVKIFNRWGEMIFASSGNQHSWNGRTFAGEEAPNGTYFFVFDINGNEFKGAVMLVR